MTVETSYPKDKIRVLLLEGVHPDALARLRGESYNIDVEKRALSEAELLDRAAEYHLIGIRSKTCLPERVIRKARRLLAVGAFCIGTNQVDTGAARSAGVPVFNAPHSNTRSVAELVIAGILMLFRNLYDKIRSAHQGEWHKSARGSVEVRGKTVGIVGYGHIGSQVSILAEALGMRVLYHDIADKLALGNAARAADLRDLLENSDVVTVHVPGDPGNAGMIGGEEIGWMKQGSFLINTSRGFVVDLEALRAALVSKHLAGAALDVFPEEPSSDADPFVSPLQGMPNVILTPHIGGSTQEAQRNIGLEVSGKLIRFTNNGSTEGAVNFPNVILPELIHHHRILHIHRNVPGVLQHVNALFGEAGINVAAQHLRTQEDVGYLIMDIAKTATRAMIRELARLPETIRVRALF